MTDIRQNSSSERTVNSEFSTRLRKAIKEHLGATFTQFARRINVPYRTLQNQLHFGRSPDLETLKKFHDAGIDLNWLVAGKGNSPKRSEGWLT